jgi:cephalosporin hydroxylase
LSERNDYWFTNGWFEKTARRAWDQLLPQIKPRRVLEVGSYEGASACYLVARLAAEAPLELHCVDTWEGGIEHQPGASAAADMNAVEGRFHYNIQIAIEAAPHPVDLVVHKGRSDDTLARLLADGRRGAFDFIYIDGSHQAPDVLTDAVLAFPLLRVGGVMAFDDYLWAENLPYGRDPLRCPKPAIDAFLNLNFRRLAVISAPNDQLYARKLDD